MLAHGQSVVRPCEGKSASTTPRRQEGGILKHGDGWRYAETRNARANSNLGGPGRFFMIFWRPFWGSQIPSARRRSYSASRAIGSTRKSLATNSALKRKPGQLWSPCPSKHFKLKVGKTKLYIWMPEISRSRVSSPNKSRSARSCI